MKLKKSPCCVSFLQSLGLVSYISLVSVIFWKGNEWFPKMHDYLGPLIFLTVFALSALVCALITLSYPFTLWQKGKAKDALRIVFYTALWTVGFLIIFLVSQVILVQPLSRLSLKIIQA